MTKCQTHTWIRMKGKKDLFRCAAPDCKQFKNKAWLEGKRACCPLCGMDFILTNEQLRNKTPRCNACKRVVAKSATDNTLEEMLGL